MPFMEPIALTTEQQEALAVTTDGSSVFEKANALIRKARIGGQNLSRVEIDEMIRFTPIIADLGDADLDAIDPNRTLSLTGPASSYNIRPTGAAAMRVLNTNGLSVAAINKKITELQKAGEYLAKLNAIDKVKFGDALLTTQLAKLGVVTLQDFMRGTDKAHVGMFWFKCATRAAQKNNNKGDKEELVFVPSCYKDDANDDGYTYGDLMDKIDWDAGGNSSLNDYGKARRQLLKTNLITKQAVNEMLVRTPVFIPIPIALTT